MEIIELFPTIVGKSKLGRDFTEKEKDAFGSFDMTDNFSNMVSVDNYVLNNRNLLSLKKEISKKCEEFINTVYSPIPENKNKIYLTQSWINISEKNQSHHPHKHPNSFISGVLYLMGEDEVISFFKSNFRMIQITPQKWTKYNSNQWDLPVSKGDIIFFSSDLEHSVPKNKNDQIRASLSFNTFISGHFGIDTELTKLILT